MPRYVVLEGHTGTFAVLDTARPDWPRHVCRGTEAEARLCAWALNHVAEHRVVVALVSPDDAPDGPRYAGFYCDDYTGPTEGIAP